MLEHFWERYDFSDTLHANQQVGEQGLVDFVTLMTHADSATCAKAVNAFADSISSSEQRLGRFEDLLRVLPWCDSVKFYDNRNGFQLVALWQNGLFQLVGFTQPQWLKDLIRLKEEAI